MTRAATSPPAQLDAPGRPGGIGVISARRPPEQALGTAAVALGRTARATVPGRCCGLLLTGRRGRAVVDVALGGHGSAGPFGDDPRDLYDALPPFLAQTHLIAGPHRVRGFDAYPVDPDVPRLAGAGRGRAGLGQPDRPDPAVHPPRLIIGHPATVMRWCAAPGSGRCWRGQREAPGRSLDHDD